MLGAGKREAAAASLTSDEKSVLLYAVELCTPALMYRYGPGPQNNFNSSLRSKPLPLINPGESGENSVDNSSFFWWHLFFSSLDNCNLNCYTAVIFPV